MARCNWHIDVPVDESDPFATAPADVRTGVRFDLREPDVLRAKLIALTVREEQLRERGMTCSIKDRPDSCCSACPLYGRAQTRALCKVGREQERTTMAMVTADA